jgi:Tol biopolymer transport system component
MPIDLKTDLQRGAEAFGPSILGLDDLRRRRTRRERRRRASAGLTALVITSLAGAALWQAFRPASNSATVGTGGAENGPITFTIGELGGSMEGIEIGSVEPDGSGVSTLAEGVRDFVTGGWSPDGRQIVFSKEGANPGTADIWIMDADGTNAHALTSGPAWDGWAQWSPIGDRIAFVRTAAWGAKTSQSGLYVMDPDGSNLQPIVEGVDWPSVLFFSWSPQGDRLAFTSYGSKQEGIFTINADGTNPQLVFEGSGGTVLWSPDGSQLLFDSNLGVSVMNADGSGIRSLIAGGQMQTYETFRWSPDGTQILYVRPVEEELSDQLHVIDANGTNDRVLADDLTWRDGGATWSPDGSLVAFNRAGDIWTVALEGNEERRMTDTPEYESTPSWGVATP